MKKYTRRDFINQTTQGTIGLLAYPYFKNTLANKAQLDKSVVVKVKDENVISNNAINQSVVQDMIDAGIRSLTGIDNVADAWKSLFPGITQTSVISIKVNCIARQDNPAGLASHPEVAYSIVNGLTAMEVEGLPFPEENIIIWDRSDFELERSNYSINKGDSGVKCFGTREELSRCGKSGGYDTSIRFNVNGSTQYLSKILTEMSDYLINLSVLKNHSGSGVTLSLKNHYGSCWCPLYLHGSNGRCDPYIPALNALSPIRQKQVISICDAIYGIISWGPMGPPQITPKSIILSRDPVAHDTIGVQLLKEHNASDYTINKATYINKAANDPYNLGTNDLEQIDLVPIENPSTGINKPKTEQQYPENFRLFQNYPNPFNAQTTISYQLFEPARVKLDIYDIQGRPVRRLVEQHQDIGYYRVTWDGKTTNSNSVPSGTYLGHFQIGNVRHTLRMQLIK